jgi:hypothetical protein
MDQFIGERAGSTRWFGRSHELDRPAQAAGAVVGNPDGRGLRVGPPWKAGGCDPAHRPGSTRGMGDAGNTVVSNRNARFDSWVLRPTEWPAR